MELKISLNLKTLNGGRWINEMAFRIFFEWGAIDNKILALFKFHICCSTYDI